MNDGLPYWYDDWRLDHPEEWDLEDEEELEEEPIDDEYI